MDTKINKTKLYFSTSYAIIRQTKDYCTYGELMSSSLNYMLKNKQKSTLKRKGVVLC